MAIGPQSVSGYRPSSCAYTVVHSIVARMGCNKSDEWQPAALAIVNGALEEACIAVTFKMMDMVSAEFAISLTLRLYQKESSQHAKIV